jgi:hypothetical protein
MDFIGSQFEPFHKLKQLALENFMNKTIKMLRIIAVLITLTISALANADAQTTRSQKMSIEKVEFDIPALKAQLVLSHPAYLASLVEETPYQLLQLCDLQGVCKTMRDERGEDTGFTVSDDATISFSPDRKYLILFRLSNVDAKTKTFGGQYYEILGLIEGHQVGFQTLDGKDAETGNILQWSPQHPHALEISISHGIDGLAYPEGEQ